MSNDSEVTFHDEFVKLTDAMKAVTETDIKLNAPICKYVDAYNRTIRSKHEELFVKIFDENYASILTETERGSWLNNKEKEVKIMFGTGKAGAFLPFTEVYRKAKIYASNSYKMISKPLTPLYPNIILLHLYRIFNLLKPDDNLMRKIKIIENELRGKTDNNNFDISSIASGLLDTARKTVPKKYLPLVDQVASLTTSDNLNKIMGNLTELAEAGQVAMPEITKGLEKVTKGEKDITSLLQDVVTNPEVSKRLGGVKDTVKDVMNVMKTKGFEFAPELEDKVNTGDFGDVFKTLMDQSELKEDIELLNSSVSKLIDNSGSSSSEDTQTLTLVEKLKQLPTEQLQELMEKMSNPE